MNYQNISRSTQMLWEYKISSIPPTTHKFPKAETEVQILLKSTEFDKLVGVGDFEKKPDAANINNEDKK